MEGYVRKYSDIRRVLAITLVLNLAVAIGKLVVGHMSSTLSMVADGYHSLLDASSNVLGFVAIYFAYKPADEDHQYGHRKYETLSAMAISVALFAAAYRILAEAYDRLYDPVTPQVGILNFVVMIATLMVNVGVSRYEQREGERLKSQILVSDAAHTRSDVFASSAVLISLVAARIGWYSVDTVASIVIAGIIIRIGYRIVSENLGVIADAIVIEPGEVEAIVATIDGVRGCGRIRTRGTLDHVFMDLVCYVTGSITLREAHELADRIENRVQREFPDVKDIVVHLEPEELRE